VGISYSGRTYEEGKKIVWKDGLRALWCLMKYSVKEPTMIPSQAAHTMEPKTLVSQAPDEQSSHLGRF
jgi:hypothetical protein